MMNRTDRSAIAWILAAAAALGAARCVNHLFDRLTWQYYGFLNIPSASVDAAPSLGGCDLFLYQGGQSVARAIDFLTLYFAAVVLTLVVARLSSPRLRPLALLVNSVFFMFLVLPGAAAGRMLAIVAGLFGLASLPLGRGLRAATFAAGGLALLATLGHDAVAACATNTFALGDAAHPLVTFPTVFVGLGLLLKTFRRLCWVTHDMQCGDLRRPAALDFFLLFLGLPFLIGNGVTAGYAHFSGSYREAGSLEPGARTVAGCFLAALLLVCVARLGFFPAAPVLFDHCAVWSSSLAALWAGVALTCVADYLFLLATEQTSVGVARLFGYAMHDNYHVPLFAASPAEFWRRWNIYWRNFHLAAIYYPIVLPLARRAGRRRAWHVMLATAVTFTATWLLNVIPYWMFAGALLKALPLGELAAGLAIYFGVQGVGVAFSLAWESHGAARVAPRWARVLAVVLTFAFVALLRVFVDPQWTSAEKLALATRALGLHAVP